MYKKIELNKNRILVLSIEKQSHLNMITIQEYFACDGELRKDYSMSIWDDISFNAYDILHKEEDKMLFEFDIDHPLYQPFLQLLNGDKELIIDDDGTREHNKKYLKISIDDNLIILSYINNLEKKPPIFTDIFNVFIKNIMFDGRSKIDQQYKDTKHRLINFFGLAVNSLLEYDNVKNKTLKK